MQSCHYSASEILSQWPQKQYPSKVREGVPFLKKWSDLGEISQLLPHQGWNSNIKIIFKGRDRAFAWANRGDNRRLCSNEKKTSI